MVPFSFFFVYYSAVFFIFMLLAVIGLDGSIGLGSTRRRFFSGFSY